MEGKYESTVIFVLVMIEEVVWLWVLVMGMNMSLKSF